MTVLWRAGGTTATRCPIRTAREHGLRSLPLAASGMESMTPTLPYSGGLLEQPAVLMDAISLWLEERAALKPPDRK